MPTSQLTFELMRSEIRHRRRFRHLTRLWHLRKPRHCLRRVVRHGIIWNLPFIGMYGSIIKKGCWEHESVEYFFTESCRRGSEIMLDIEANMGYYSMLAAKMELFSEIHAIEPMPDNIARLRWHISANKYEDIVHVHETALSDRDGEIKMCGNVVSRNGEGDATVPCSTLDSMYDFTGRRLSIKIDTDGHEISALRGGERLLSRNDIFMQAEVMPSNTSLVDYLLSVGFSMLWYQGENFYFERSQKSDT